MNEIWTTEVWEGGYPDLSGSTTIQTTYIFVSSLSVLIFQDNIPFLTLVPSAKRLYTCWGGSEGGGGNWLFNPPIFIYLFNMLLRMLCDIYDYEEGGSRKFLTLYFWKWEG